MKKEALCNAPGEKCNDIEVLAETSEIFDSEHCTEVNGSHDLADIITGGNIKSKLHWQVWIFDKTLSVGSGVFV